MIEKLAGIAGGRSTDDANGGDRRVLVIGAGPGGLAAAAALTRVGIPVAVFERTPDLPPVGAGLGVQASTMKALMRIGVGQRLLEEGNELGWSDIYTARGKRISRLPIRDLTAKIGAPQISVLRRALQTVLVEALPDGVLRLGSECVGVEQDDAGVVAKFADGTEERGAVLIGADGGRSSVRKAVFADADPKYSGFTSWRAVVPPLKEMQLDTSYIYFGRARLFVTFPCAKDVVYWGVSRATAEGGRDEPGTVKQHLLKLLESFTELPRSLIESTPEDGISRVDIYDRDPVPSWVRGRVVLIGDAAHQTAPLAGQGASNAMEDAIVLARELALTSGLEDQRMLTAALESYQAKRLEVANATVAHARRLAKLLKVENPVVVGLRNLLLGPTLRRSQSGRYAEQTGYDV